MIVLFFVASLISQFYAQPTLVNAPVTNIKFGQIGLEQGLSQSTVYAIAQDKQGFMWFGTQDGLNRYDGYSIKVFKHDPADPNSIAHNWIYCLLIDREGNLWAGNAQGSIDCYINSENKFYNYQLKTDDKIKYGDNPVTSIYEDKYGEIWIGTRRRGLYRLRKETKTFSAVVLDNNLKDYMVRAITEDPTGNLWVGTNYGLYKLKINLREDINSIVFKHKPLDTRSISSDNIRTLFIDSSGKLWIGTWGGGLNCFDETTNVFKKYVHNEKDHYSIASNFISSIYEDTKGKLWVATFDKGLNILNRETGRFDKYLNNESLWSLYEDKSGIIWMGTTSSGLKIYDRHRNKFTHYYE